MHGYAPAGHYSWPLQATCGRNGHQESSFLGLAPPSAGADLHGSRLIMIIPGWTEKASDLCCRRCGAYRSDCAPITKPSSRERSSGMLKATGFCRAHRGAPDPNLMDKPVTRRSICVPAKPDLPYPITHPYASMALYGTATCDHPARIRDGITGTTTSRILLCRAAMQSVDTARDYSIWLSP